MHNRPLLSQRSRQIPSSPGFVLLSDKRSVDRRLNCFGFLKTGRSVNRHEMFSNVRLRFRYGSWVCRTNTGSTVSSGGFANSVYAPFASPFTSTECPGRGKVYLHDVACNFTFMAPQGRHIYVEFLHFDLDRSCGDDRVEISSYPGRRLLCRRARSSFDVSSSGRMTVVFRSDGGNRCSGFSAFFTSYKMREYKPEFKVNFSFHFI